MVRRVAVFATGAILSLGYPVFVSAQAALNNRLVPCDGINCTVCDIATLAQNVLNLGIYMAVFLSAVLFAWAGFKAVTSGGNTEQYTQARKIFANVAIGLVIILVGWLVVDTLMKTVTNGSFGPWNKICETFISFFDHHYA